MRAAEQIGFSPSPAAPAVKTDGLATVIVACCGQLEYTRLCVPSLLRFTRQPYELLFLDSDSRDGTAEYLEGLAGAAPVPVEVARVPADPPVGSAKKDEVIPLRGEFVALQRCLGAKRLSSHGNHCAKCVADPGTGVDDLNRILGEL